MKAGKLVLDKPVKEVVCDHNTNLERIFLNVLQSP